MSYGSSADIDERDPLGLGELQLPELPAEAVDLAAIAAMARTVEDARFDAERRLHNSLRTAPAPRPRASIDPVVRRMAAQAEQATVTQAKTPPAPPAGEHHRASMTAAGAATAALRDLLSDVDRPSTNREIPAPRTDSAPTEEMPRPAKLHTDTQTIHSGSSHSGADTASLLRELASLSGANESGPAGAPSGMGQRPATRPATTPPPIDAPKRKNRFAR